MRENDVWEEGVGPSELGIWELKEDLHCYNETMPILCILLDQQSGSNGKVWDLDHILPNSKLFNISSRWKEKYKSCMLSFFNIFRNSISY